jgi:hypothetical protein
MSETGFRAFLGSMLFLFFLFPEVFVMAQSADNVGASPTRQAANPTEANAPAIPDASKVIQRKSFTLEGEQVWLDTGIGLEPGQRIAVSSEGSLRYADARADNGPEGLTRGFKDLIRILPYNGAGRGAVIGRIGDADIAQPFLIGAKKEIVAPVSGKLALGINQTDSDTGTGSYTVTVDVYAADSSAPREIAKEVSKIPGVDNRLFEKIPRRIGDRDGNAGDMVNFLILGDEDQMKKVFTNAGWVKVDADVKETVLTGIIASLSKESYLTMPMSPLYLFGRPQDYGWAHAEPITVVASRNHLRIWKAPFTVNGEMLWVGAATHDIGFEKDQRNNGLTHKIDPDIDLEKDYVQKTLSSTGLVAEVLHFLPKRPMVAARTATGGTFHSNGLVLVMKLAESSKSTTAESK